MNKFYTTLFISLLPTLLLAHGVHGSGIMAGISHPILGVDHNIAIISCAIIGYLNNAKRWYLLPVAFIITMIGGGLVGIGNEATLLIEKVIALSVLVNGILIAITKKSPFIALILLMAAIGFVHGYAHGAEMPESNTAFKYVSGYVIGALALTIVGWAISKWTTIETSESVISKTLIGGIVIGCGMMMILP